MDSPSYRADLLKLGLLFAFTGLLGLASLFFTGCVSPAFPKDSVILDGDSKVNTPWGSASVSAKEIRTGKAAVPAK